MKNPPHPGLAVRLDCLEPLGLRVTKGAAVLGVTRQALNNLVNEKAGISPEMAIRLAKAFGSRAEVWLGMQMAYDLAQARLHEDKIVVQRVAPPCEQPHASSSLANSRQPRREGKPGCVDLEPKARITMPGGTASSHG